MNFPKISFFICLLATNANAASPLLSANVLKCPAIPDAYSKMITDLTVLKTTIKETAQCQAVSLEVKSLSDLLAKREEVAKLIKKGETEPLTDRELESVRVYVEEITSKVLNTADLINRSNYCFAEDRKQFGFADLASIALDATALARTVAGPWSLPVALGGQAIAGIFQSLDKVVKSRNGYDFDGPKGIEARQSYVQSLCAYYNYRKDIDSILYPEERANELNELKLALDQHIEGIRANCPECNNVVAAFGNTEETNRWFRDVNAKYEEPLGTYTLRAIRSREWVRLAEEQQEEIADNSPIGRDLLSEMKDDIDRFFFEKEGPRFIAFQNRKAHELLREFYRFVDRETDEIMRASVRKIPKELLLDFLQQQSRSNPIEKVEFMGRLKKQLQEAGEASLANRVASFERESKSLIYRTKLALEVRATYCTFFQKAEVYGGALQNECDSIYGSSVEKNLEKLFPKEPGEPDGNAILAKNNAKVPYVPDWVEALLQTIHEIDRNPNLYRRK